MPPKGGNAKKESGRAKKAENESKKKDAAAVAKESKEADEWSKGAKDSKTDKEDRRKAELARKAENARLLAEEETSAPAKVKAAPKAGNKAKPAPPKPAGPGAIAAGGGLGAGDKQPPDGAAHGEVESYSATGIDNALDLLDVVNAKMDKASIGSQAGGLEKHPERRFKGAYEAYEQRELPKARADHPGLRLQQYKELLFKQFQKSPENPFNQTTVAYDATKEERVDALTAKRSEVENRLREKAK